MVTIFFEQLHIITVERMAYILSKHKEFQKTGIF